MERPEPAFRTSETDSLFLPRESGRSLSYLEMHLARRPDDLKGHTRRVLLACRSNDPEATYGAMVDLFIALAGRGTSLKATLLARAALQLGPPQRHFLASRLGSGIRADEPLRPSACRSVLTLGLIGAPRRPAP